MPLEDWKKLVAAPTAELLKTHGFRKKGWQFSAEREDAVLRVGFQSSQMSDRTQLKVTVNLSIHLPALDGLLGSEHWGMRLGAYMAPPRDHWWVCHTHDEATRAGLEIAALIERTALPEMEGLASSQALKTLWTSGKSPGLTEKQRVCYLEMLLVGKD